MAINVTGLLDSLGLAPLERQATDFLLKRAAEWARVPTRIRRIQSALTIVGGAATQRNNLGVVATVTAAQQGVAQVQAVYDSASGDVADVVETIRTLAPGQMPPAGIVPKAAKAAGAVTGVLQSLTTLERTVMSAGAKVLTPDQLKQLQSGVSFPSFMAGSAKWLLYALLAYPVYLVVAGKSKGTRKW